MSLLNDEIGRLSCGEVTSDRMIVFCAVILQHDHLVKNGVDIHRLLKRRMEAWKLGVIFVCLFVSCDGRGCQQLQFQTLVAGSNNHRKPHQHLVVVYVTPRPDILGCQFQLSTKKDWNG